MARVIQTDKVIDAEEGDLRVWWVRNPPNYSEFHVVSSPAGAINVLLKLITADLHNPLVAVNEGGLEVFEDNDWIEWYDGDGNSIGDLT